MALSWNDLQSRAEVISTDIDEDALVSGRVRIFSISVTAAGDAATVFINDATTKAGGGTTITVGAATTETAQLRWPRGIQFTNLSIDNTGTTPSGTVTYIVDP